MPGSPLAHGNSPATRFLIKLLVGGFVPTDNNICAQTIRQHGGGRSAPRRVVDKRFLLELHLPPGFLEFLLSRLGLSLRRLLEDGLRGFLNQLLGIG